MHIPDGILTSSLTGTGIVALGWVGTAIGVGVGLSRLEPEEMPRAGLLTSLFFVVSLIQIPLGVKSVHLVLNGLLGLVLGWMAFPAILIALGLQWLFFGQGGLSTLGINTWNMALPAVACWYILGRFVRSGRPRTVLAASFATGFLSILLSASLTAGCIALAGQEFRILSWVIWVSDAMLAIVEGFVTAAAIQFLHRVRPEVFQTSPRVVSRIGTEP